MRPDRRLLSESNINYIKFMIYKRHLLTFGPTLDFDNPTEEEKEKKILGMGLEEQWEAIRGNSLTPRTWWRKWLKMK